ncbi:alpha-D-ribose 1-methylphosphonate 5-triphosphate diphosphatase [Amaricoccus solimangrovi]|uniref:Alpha-D-ribose 1-methylphosphonate 5-triphosphate diphosphatase n=1 Tax=Amaricoccus solimangrovi TaxID=2589815 RepID=A0A501WRY2_9RHOB|nr:alpha-D-ribose 1-methylphosphonate 5-triphosphate diphosphatase [Amaricoccus solimangrovi]TPE52128.1 alpha-D-ribose 1-methylphosphonate 5-triphosphate diphosphatase [Amaricoccus solimangrovi]
MPHETAAPQPLRLANARLVLEDRVSRGGLVLSGGRIAEIVAPDAAGAGAIDCAGDYLLPGLVELHTDNLERHLQPRPGVRWPETAAILAHDAEIAGTGITTVFDALRVGSLVGSKAGYAKYARGLATAIGGLRGAGALKADHHLHLRAEMCSETLIGELAEFLPEDGIGIVSLMDHTPGQRQFRDVDQMRRYQRGRLDEAEFQAHVARLLDLRRTLGAAHERAAVAAARRLGAVIASHDDTDAAHVATSAAHGASLAEFPTTSEAARACRAAGIAVMMGAPNLLRGGSHSGNVAAAELAGAGLLDILSSDYIPSALLLGAFRLGEMTGDLPAAVATVTAAPARAARLADRGRIAPGLRADLARVRVIGGLPVVRGVWVAGARVA